MIKEVDREQWDRFVELSPQGTIFSSSKWGVCFDAKIKYYGYFKNDSLLGGIAVPDSNLPITQFQGILCAPSEAKYVNLLSYQNEVAFNLMEVCPQDFSCSYFYPDIRPFMWNGYQSSVRYTFMVHPDWNELEKDTRYEIKNSAITVSRSDDAELFDSLYDYTFYHKNLKRTASPELIKKVIELGELYISSDKSCGVVLLKDSKRYYYILGASLSTGTSSKTVWEAIKDKKEIDLVGCNNRDISRFKSGFGGTLMPYYNLKI